MLRRLRESELLARLCNVIGFLARRSGKREGEAVRLHLSLQTLSTYVEISPLDYENVISELTRRAVIIPQGNGLFLIADETKLLSVVRTSAETLEAA